MGHSLRGFSNHDILQAKTVAEIFPTKRSNPHLFRVLNWETGSLPPGKPIYKIDMLRYLTVFPFLIVSWLPSLVCSKMRCTCKIINWNVWIAYYSFNLCILFHLLKFSVFSSVQLSSVTQSCLTLCDHMNHSAPGLPVHHQLLEFTQTHLHRVSDAIQPSHPLSSPSPLTPNPSQHQSLFQWVSSSHEVAKVLEFQL